MCNRFSLLVLIVALVMTGCSTFVIHPPSASAFMEKSEGHFQKNVSVSAYMGNLLYFESMNEFYSDDKYVAIKNVKNEKDPDLMYESIEMPVEIALEIQRSFGYFKYGIGFDFITPYVQAGFVSDYFGIMGWSNFGFMQPEKVEFKYVQWGGGVSLIEQLPFGDNFRMGLTQHLSRNGREVHASEGFAYTHCTPVFYDEIGGGGYISFVPGKTIRMGLEFRYGRDLTYRRVYRGHPDGVNVDRYVVTFNVQGW